MDRDLTAFRKASVLVPGSTLPPLVATSLLCDAMTAAGWTRSLITVSDPTGGETSVYIHGKLPGRAAPTVSSRNAAHAKVRGDSERQLWPGHVLDLKFMTGQAVEPSVGSCGNYSPYPTITRRTRDSSCVCNAAMPVVTFGTAWGSDEHCDSARGRIGH